MLSQEAVVHPVDHEIDRAFVDKLRALVARSTKAFEEFNYAQVLQETESASTIETLPLPADDPKVRRPDITIARGELGWDPTIELREGIARTIPYFRAELERHDAKARTI